MYFVRAGFRTVSLHHLVMVEDGLYEPGPNKAIPADVLRATLVNGRVLDFEGAAAEVLRRHVALVTVRSPAVDMPDVGSHEVPVAVEAGGEPCDPGSGGGAAEAV